MVLATWISPFISRLLVPAVPCRSPDQFHAIYTPDTAHPITRSPMSLSQGMETPLVLMSILWMTTRQQWFRFIRLSDPYLPSYYSHFTSTLMTITLNNSHLKWFEASFWKATSKGLPSSPTELIHKLSVIIHNIPPACVPAAHSQLPNVDVKHLMLFLHLVQWK